MNPKDRWIVLAAAAGMLTCVACAVALTPAIQRERIDAQLTASDDVRDAMPADVATLYMGLGAFRGIFVDMAWARMESMKQEGKFWEADQLARVVTKLQPRFPKVWEYHAWNLAYNISVATKTPNERWKWVSDGVSVLRDEGIPLNPKAVSLYKELGWIFLHKIGMFSDDMHWHYKERLAAEWHVILGPPRAGMAPKLDAAGEPVLDAKGKAVMEYAAIAEMRLIAAMYERYLNRNQLTTGMVKELDRLSADPMMAGYVDPLKPHSFERFKVKLRRLADRLSSAEPAARAKLEPLLAMTSEHESAIAIPALRRLAEAEPEVAAQLEALAAMGYALSAGTSDASAEQLRFVREVGTLLERVDDETLRILGTVQDPGKLTASQIALLDWLLDPERAEARRRLLAFLRARVLHDQYHMDPMWMLEIMKGDCFKSRGDHRAKYITEDTDPSIPLDWRHPAAHALYWCSMGVRVSQGLLRPGDYDVLNTDRTVLHALQQLRDTGRITYDPASRYYRQLPDPRFIDAYHEAVVGAWDRILTEETRDARDVGAAPETFQAGHENFLIWATEMAYFWGDAEQAQRYYRALRRLYSNYAEGRAERYSQPVEDFVLREFISNDQFTGLDDANMAVQGMIDQAIRVGLVEGRGDLARRRLKDAERMHALYQKKQNYKTESGGPDARNRMGLPPFPDMVAAVFGTFLVSAPQEVPTGIKTRAWRNAPDGMKLLVYDRAYPRLAAICRENNPPLPVDEAFAPPAGLEQFRAAQKAEEARRRGAEEDAPAPLIRKKIGG